MVFEWIGIGLGVALGAWGLFHQLIVGGAVSTFKEVSENEARLFVMSWVAQGAFMSFLGILPAIFIIFNGAGSSAAHTIFIPSALALLLLSTHVFVTGYSTHIKPIRYGAIIELVFGLYLVFLTLYT